MAINQGPSVVVVGAGAVGCYFGGMLARAGVPVTLIGRAQHMEAIARNGLLLEGIHVNERIPAEATTHIEAVRKKQVVLFCVKTVDTEKVAHAVQPLLEPGALLLSFQNGVDNVDRIFAATGIRAIPVAVYVAAAMTGAGHVTHTGRGDLIMGYRAGWPHQPDLKPLAAFFEHAEIPCKLSECIERDLWSKMVMNCAYNAISALARAKYGRILDFEPVRATMERAIEETAAVAQAEGVSIPATALIDAALRLGEAMRGATSSTSQDIRRGRPTEIDSLNGFVSRRGAALGIPTPVNDTLYALVKLLEQSDKE